MKKFLALLSALVLALVALSASPAHAAETTSNASIYNSSLSNGTLQYRTAWGAGAIFYLNIGKTRYSPYGNPVVDFKVPSGCRAEITTLAITSYLSGGVWHRWVGSNGVQFEGTETVRVRC